MSAATRPTCCLSAPVTVIPVAVGAAIVIPFGVWKTTSWEKPRLSPIRGSLAAA